MKKPVIANKQQLIRIPWFGAITIWLLLDRLQSPGYVHGIVWTLFGLVACVAISQIFTTEQREVVFKDKEAKP